MSAGCAGQTDGMGIFAITGSASGMGAATRKRLEAAAHQVIGVDLRDAEVIADLSTPTGRAEAVEAVTDACNGTLDGLATAAGLGPPVDAKLIAKVNFFGSRALLEGLRPALAQAPAAQVVQFGSNSASTTPNVPPELLAAMLEDREDDAISFLHTVDEMFGSAIAYTAAKLAIARWCRRVATGEDWAGEGIRLNVLAPGPVDTPLYQVGRQDDFYGPLMESFPVPLGTTPDATAMSVWAEQMLIGEGAGLMCGSVVYVDGGTDALLRPDAWPETYAT